MTWARPDLLALLLLVPVAILVVLYAERTRWRHLTLLAALDVLPTILPPRLRTVRTWQAVLAVVTTLGLALAAAGPRLGFEWQQQKVEGVSIVVVLDVSRSMDAQDVPPSRIERARREILDLVALLRGDAVGLVIFAAGPYVRIPLTVDYDTFTWAVKDSSSGTIRAQGSALAGALEAAAGLLEKAEGSGKAILLVSDGESHDEPAEMDAALARVRAADVRVYALGIGEPAGAPIPLEEGGFKKDATGDVVLSRLDEDVLRRLAASTGGAYVRAVASDEDVRALYETEIRGKLAASERGVRREKLWHERFQWPLGLALVSLSISGLLGIGRRRVRASRGAAAAAVLFCALTLAYAGPARAGAAEDGQAALRAQQWDRAAELLGQARVDDPGDLQAMRGLAEALYRSGRVREAEQIFRTLAEQDAPNRAIHLYNAGNAAYRGGRLANALDDFRSAAQADPTMKPAQTNATAVEREMAARVEPPPPESGDDQGEEQAGEQEEQASGEQQGQPGQQGEDGQAEGQQEQPGEGGQEQGGEQGKDPSEGDGQASEGPPPAGEPPGVPQSGSRSDDEGQREGTPAQGAEGQPTAEQSGAEADTTVSAEGDDGADATGQAGDDTPNGTGEMTREQAARLVDSVPDGTPRVVVGGRGTEMDW
jgi:Ca-activated chloride channel family protein